MNTIVAVALMLALSAHAVAAPLHDAAEKGDTKAIAALLDAGTSPNLKTGAGDTPLHWAASRGHIEAIAVLLDAGADPNLKNRREYTPLGLAKRRGHTKAGEVLLASMRSKPNPELLRKRCPRKAISLPSPLCSP